MKLHEHPTARINMIGGHAPGRVLVNGRWLAAPFLLAPTLLHDAWIAGPDVLVMESLAPLWPLEPRVLLLGIDRRDHPAIKALRGPLAARQLALEAMDIGAACRTYNVLAQEDRPVAALLFP
ncbi:MAG TPA: Mth938-like domain-containing protein [Steroidobacteraceae bacterium]|nr:Mth938-like domain-containing protein [Steroidobacteraceae bacterium]